jgi:hypothetical protein
VPDSSGLYEVECRNRWLCRGALDLHRNYVDSAAVGEKFFGDGRLVVEPDQIVDSVPAGYALTKQLAQRSNLRHLDLVGESTAVIVQKKDLDGLLLII